QRKDDIRQAKADAERRQKERAESRVTGRWRVDDLKREIEDIHRTTPSSNTIEDDGSDRGRLLAKRKRLITSINELVQIMPTLVRDYERISADLAETTKDLARKRDSNGNKAQPPVSDMEARAARLVAQRMAALTGQPLEEFDGGIGVSDRVREEIASADRKHAERRDRVQSITSGLDHVSKAMRDLKATPAAGSASLGDSRKWEDGVGVVSEEVRDLVNRLRYVERQKSPAKVAGNAEANGFSSSSSAAATAAYQHPSSLESPSARASAFSPVITSLPPPPEIKKPEGPTIAERLALATSKQERDRILQDIAEERFRERQRALGIPDPAPVESPSSSVSVPVKRPEMQERTSVASNPFANQSADVSSVPADASAPRAVVAPAVAATPVDVQTFGDDSSDDDDDDEDEWDRDDSSDDDDLPSPLGPDLFGPSRPSIAATSAAANISRLRAESPASSVSFDTAFANPSAGNDDEVNAAMSVVVAAAAKDESNPFLGLLAASSASVSASVSAS
ncbi:actin organization and endocytosis protein, partial [Coemansia sp. RSA 2052]